MTLVIHYLSTSTSCPSFLTFSLMRRKFQKNTWQAQVARPLTPL